MIAINNTKSNINGNKTNHHGQLGMPPHSFTIASIVARICKQRHITGIILPLRSSYMILSQTRARLINTKNIIVRTVYFLDRPHYLCLDLAHPLIRWKFEIIHSKSSYWITSVIKKCASFKNNLIMHSRIIWIINPCRIIC